MVCAATIFGSRNCDVVRSASLGVPLLVLWRCGSRAYTLLSCHAQIVGKVKEEFSVYCRTTYGYLSEILLHHIDTTFNTRETLHLLKMHSMR